MKLTLPRVIEAASGLVAVGTAGAWLWAMSEPRSFDLTVAPFPPYSQHLVHDIGAFQPGLGGCLAIGLFVRNALTAVLAGSAVGGVTRFASHVVDHGRGGHSSDLFALGALAMVLVALSPASALGPFVTRARPGADRGGSP